MTFWEALYRILLEIQKYLEKQRQVQPVKHLSKIYMKHGDNMEEYTIHWVASQSTFVDKNVINYRLDGGGVQTLLDMPPSQVSAVIEASTGATVELWIVTYGDNDTTAASEHLTFVAKNEEPVKAVTGLTAVWRLHKP